MVSKTCELLRGRSPVTSLRLPVMPNREQPLLSMKTEIPDYADAAVAVQVADPLHHFTRDELIALALSKCKSLPKIGGNSTTNYIILGEIMQKRIGKLPKVWSMASLPRRA